VAGSDLRVRLVKKAWEIVRDFQATCEVAEADLSTDQYEEFLMDCHTDISIRCQRFLADFVSQWAVEQETAGGGMGIMAPGPIPPQYAVLDKRPLTYCSGCQGYFHKGEPIEAEEERLS